MPHRRARPTSSLFRRTLSTAVALVAVLIGTGRAAATEARLIGLGGIGDYLEDDRNVKRWYGSLLDYPDLIVVDSGTFGIDGYPRYRGLRLSGPAVGSHLRFDDAGRWGTLAVYAEGKGHPGNPGNLVSDTVQLSAVTLLYGRTVAGLQAGVVCRIFPSEDSFTGAAGADFISFREERNQLDLGLGARLDLGETAYLDVAGEIRRARLETEIERQGYGAYSSGTRTSWSNFGLRARAFLGLGERTALVPVAEYLHEDRPVPYDPLYLVTDLNGYLLRLGCGLDFLPDIDSLVFLSVDLQTSEIDYSHQVIWVQDTPLLQQRRWHAVSARVGLEKRFQSWLTLRAATGYVWCRDEVDEWGGPAGTETTRRIPLSLGLAGHLYALDLELAVTNQQPLQSPVDLPAEFYVVPGNPTWLAFSAAFAFD